MKYGGEAIVQDLGPHFDLGATNAARNRFFGMMGASLPDDWAEIGDLNMGATLAFGFPHVGGSSDEWFLSDYLVVWMMNPSVTQMPTRTSCSRRATRALGAGGDRPGLQRDRHPRRPVAAADRPAPTPRSASRRRGTSGRAGRIDLDYVREQTDLPILVRLDTGRFLRELGPRARRGATTCSTCGIRVTQAPVPAPGCQGNDDR